MYTPQRNTRLSISLRVLIVVLSLLLTITLSLHLLTITCSKYQPLSDHEISKKMEEIKRRKEDGKVRKMCYKDGKYVPLEEVIKNVSTFPNGFPKILHTTWKNKQLLNKEWEKIAAVCKGLNRRFTFCHWVDEDLEDFVASTYPTFLHHFLSYPYPIQRADASRYLLLHHFGGFYKDTNIGCRVSFQTILHDMTFIHSKSDYTRSIQHPSKRDSYIYPSSNQNMITFFPSQSKTAFKNTFPPFKVLLLKVDPWGIAADFLASSPKQPFFSYIYEGLKVRPFRYGIPYLDVILGTGPMFLGEMYERYLSDHHISEHSKNELAIIPTFLHRRKYFYFVSGGTWHCLDGEIIWWSYNHIYVFCILGLLVLCLVIFCNKQFIGFFRYKIRI